MGAHPPNTLNRGIKATASMAAADVQVPATVVIVRDIAVPAGKTNNRGCCSVIRIAVTVAAIVRNNRNSAAPTGPTALPPAPRGFGRNSQRRNERNHAENVAEQRNHDSDSKRTSSTQLWTTRRVPPRLFLETRPMQSKQRAAGAARDSQS